MENTINTIVEKSKEAINKEDGDYYNEKGILICGKCNTPKQFEFELFGKKFKPNCLCKCATEKRDLLERQEKQAEKRDKIMNMRNVGFADKEMMNYTFDNDDAANKISTIAHNYVDHFTPTTKGLLLYGDVGTGKTFSACCIANALIEKGYPCMATNFSRLINTLSSKKDKQEYIDSLNDYTLLVIDDFAAERDTEYMNEMVMNIIDARYRSKKPVIITTNLTDTDFKSPDDISKRRI